MADKKRGMFSPAKKNAIQKGILYQKMRSFSTIEAKPLLNEIKVRKNNDIVRKSLTNYLIMRTVTIFEICLINQAHRLAKNNRKKAKQLFTDIRIGVPLADQLISVYSFTKLEDINHVFSIILGIDNYFSAIQKESSEYEVYSYEYAHIPYTTPLHKNWENVMKIFELRHDIIHHNKLQDLQYHEIRNLVGGIMQFLMCSIVVTNIA